MEKQTETDALEIEKTFSKLTPENKEKMRKCIYLLKDCPGFYAELDKLKPMTLDGFDLLLAKWWPIWMNTKKVTA